MVLAVLPCSMMGAVIATFALGAVRCPAQQLTNKALSVTINRQDGSYQFGARGAQSLMQGAMGAMVNRQWLRSSSYPWHSVSESPFSDALGSGQQLTVPCG